MNKLKFKTLGEFFTALEKGPLYDEDNCKVELERYCMVKEYSNGNKDTWQSLKGMVDYMVNAEFTRKPLPRDKDLVWCWDDSMVSCRNIRFFNKPHSVFNSDGSRSSCGTYENFEVIPKNSETGLWDVPFEWANEAVKKLDD